MLLSAHADGLDRWRSRRLPRRLERRPPCLRILLRNVVASSLDVEPSRVRRRRRCRGCAPRPWCSGSTNRRLQRVAQSCHDVSRDGRFAGLGICTNRSWPAMIALMQSTLPYLDADELFRLVPLAERAGFVATCLLPRRSMSIGFNTSRRRRVLGHAGGSGRRRRREVGRHPTRKPGARAADHPRRLRAVRHARRSPVALFDGAVFSTTLRTPMISALATDALARTMRDRSASSAPARRRLRTSRSRVVRPDIDRVVVAGRTAAHGADVVDELVAGGNRRHRRFLCRRRRMRRRLSATQCGAAAFRAR